MTANYVARQVGYNMTEGWKQGDETTNSYFGPLKTFAKRFSKLIADVKDMGFKALDLWTAHLNPSWATDRHLSIARQLLFKSNLEVISLAGRFGNTQGEFKKTCKLASAMKVGILGGSIPLLENNRDFVLATLKKHGLKLAIENHSEKTPEEILAKIGDSGNGSIGTVVDTGWYATHNYDPTQAIETLANHIFHIHLKDIITPGKHETCRYGQGCVPIKRCLRVLQKIKYSGGISIEHEPEFFDPTEDCRANLYILRRLFNDRN